MNQYDVVLATPLGNVGLGVVNNSLTQLAFLSHQVVPMPYSSLKGALTQVTHWLEQYFQNPHDNPFEDTKLPLFLNGTPFQRKVWHLLTKIPVGATLTYGDLARALDTSPRAIGNACRANPIPVIVPCHRVVAATGIGGYSGKTEGERIKIKKWLLDHEKADIHSPLCS